MVRIHLNMLKTIQIFVSSIKKLFFSYSFSAPLINIKKAIAKIKNEIMELDVKIGVFENEILQQKLKDKTFYQQDIDSPTFILS